MDRFYDELQLIIANEHITKDEPLSEHTTFHIGGPCDYFVHIKHEDELPKVVDLCKKENKPYVLIGNGSNLLVADEGYRGVVIKLCDSATDFQIREEGETSFVTAGAGMNLSAFAMRVANLGLTGFEFAAGIPGTLGGAVYMNAGAYGGEIKHSIVSAKVLTSEGEIITITKEDLQLSYRTSSVQTKKHLVISATFQFKKGNPEEILEKIRELNRQRKDKQPLEYPSAGSTFKRPVGYFAGKLIMDSGLRGYRVGGAMISEKHCGFVINADHATANDVLTLISDVIRIVKEKQNVTLEPEVKVLI